MKKAVMMSIKPEWCELICSGKKTLEIRKSRPGINTPFKCYIYCTKDGSDFKRNFYKDATLVHSLPLNGMVIAEFVCDAITKKPAGHVTDPILVNGCMTIKQYFDYIGQGLTGYAWHISDLRIYDEPKLLNEFRKTCADEPCCDRCAFHITESGKCCRSSRNINKAPQSWCYVEEIPCTH